MRGISLAQGRLVSSSVERNGVVGLSRGIYTTTNSRGNFESEITSQHIDMI